MQTRDERTKNNNGSWNFEAATAFNVLLVSLNISFFRNQSCYGNLLKQSKLHFPVYETPFSSMSTFACIILDAHERDITDTQSRYANRKSYITLNCRRAFQIWRTLQRRKWSPTADDPQTGNGPQIGPQMTPNRKWSPMWTANDPRRKIRMAWILDSWIFFSFFLFFSSTKR